MPKRVTLTLSDAAWAEYHKRPFRQRGEWVSTLIVAAAADDQFPRRRVAMAETILDELRRQIERLGAIVRGD